MTKEDAIRILILCDKKPNWKYTEGMIKTAQEVAAAIAIGQHAPTKLDRSLWKRCAYCQIKPWFPLPEYVKFCEYCGRPLAEEAWVELERKIGGNDGT